MERAIIRRKVNNSFFIGSLLSSVAIVGAVVGGIGLLFCPCFVDAICQRSGAGGLFLPDFLGLQELGHEIFDHDFILIIQAFKLSGDFCCFIAGEIELDGRGIRFFIPAHKVIYGNAEIISDILQYSVLGLRK